MNTISVYEYKDYKKFITDWIANGPHKGRGLRKQLAEAVGCQTAFITHVLGGDYHFSLEQAESCARWMGLNELDSEFLLLLVMHKRAGSKGLQKIFQKQISQKREEHSVLKKRVNISESLSLEDQSTYYSSWHYAAIHMALLNPALQSLDNLQKYFQLPTASLHSTLEFLTTRGFVKHEQGLYKVLKPVLHLEMSSPLILQHHTQWRLKSIEAIGTRRPENLHYSGVISLSEDDYEWVREKLSQLLKEAVERLQSSPDEKLACLNFDWFQV
ncbi:TIGR02147 family protein [Bdellovibrio svalbardensis]|uniref:DUF4423 domain-containing protein n=1 Tax=Bdellovibrio svalbardensis TaxID=2972972 RepID=A0ABT6DMB1_9BACT|nr:TIGR02147 family protein [Bdellovibrio svalbardensis]MDG0817220.1 DUF4423 domain-containing protein [Bdellovibrio svalbardensis]